MHTRVHDPSLNEKRKDRIFTRGMPVLSHTLRARGVCDLVEFRRDAGGVSLFGRKGLWLPCPVEYKRGRPKTHGADRMQLCAQAICLEEMLLCPPIQTAYLYYGEVKQREAVPLDECLRTEVRAAFAQMHKDYDRRHTPRVKPAKACGACSLRDICLPKMPKETSVEAYMQKTLAEDEASCESS
jgi:CRISPR-associated exonuclease Cas4